MGKTIAESSQRTAKLGKELPFRGGVSLCEPAVERGNDERFDPGERVDECGRGGIWNYSTARARWHRESRELDRSGKCRIRPWCVIEPQASQVAHAIRDDRAGA